VGVDVERPGPGLARGAAEGVGGEADGQAAEPGAFDELAPPVDRLPAGDAIGPQLETDDPELIDAIHRWFDRQIMDHGTHADTG